MTAVALNDTYKSAGEITGKFHFPTNAQKSITTIKEIICLTTDQESVDNSKKLLGHLDEIQSNLPVNDEDCNVEAILDQLESSNEILLKVNALMSLIDFLFSKQDAEVEIDDDMMLGFLGNMEKAKQILEFITSHLTLVLQIQKAKKEPTKKYSLEELFDLLNAA